MIALTIYHALLSFIRYWNLFRGDLLRNWSGMIVIGVVAMNIWLRDSFLFDVSNDDLQEMVTKDDSRQFAFYVWCYIEVAYFNSTWLSAGIFTLCRTFAKMPLALQTGLMSDGNINLDFLEVESLFLDLLNLTVAPLLINLQLYWFCYNRVEDSPYSPDAFEWASNAILTIQLVMFLLGFFLRRS